MLDWVLAGISAALWGTAYGWYFSNDIRRWLWRRRNRGRLAEIQRAQAYAAWMRRTAPPRGRAVPPPQPQSQQSLPRSAPAPSAPREAPARPPGVVIPFPGPRGPRAPRR